MVVVFYKDVSRKKSYLRSDGDVDSRRLGDAADHARARFERVGRVRLPTAFQAVRRVHDLAVRIQRHPGAVRLFPVRPIGGARQPVHVYEPRDGGRGESGPAGLLQRRRWRRLRRNHRLRHDARQRHVFAVIVVTDRRCDYAHGRYAAGVDGRFDAQPFHPVDALQVGTFGRFQID